jgi:hypothetical protein
MKIPVQISICVLLSTLCITSFAQLTTENTSVFFSSDRHELTRESRENLDAFIAANPIQQGCSFRIYGYTDSDGSEDYNKDLAARRCESVRNYLSVAGADAEVAALGEVNPFSDNTTEEGKQANRRVEVYLDCRVRDKVDEDLSANKVVEENNAMTKLEKLRRDSLMALLQMTPQRFYIDPASDTTLTCERGIKFLFKANSIKLPSSTVNSKVLIEVVEVFDKSDMIMQNMTTTAGNAVLESGGMYTIKATLDGKEVKMKKGETFTAMVPTDSFNENMSLFDGKRIAGEDNSVHWKERSVNDFNYFNGSGFAGCTDYRGTSMRCGFWCRMNTLFSKNYRRYIWIRSRGGSRTYCRGLESLFDKYDVKTQKQLQEALWKEEFKRWNVSNMEEYRAAVLAKQEEDLKASIESNDGYYVFSNSGFYMANCDFYSSYNGEVVALNIGKNDREDAYCTYLIQRQNTCLPVSNLKTSFYVRVPENKDGVVVAMRYRNGNVELAVHHVSDKSEKIQLVYETVSIEELKMRISELNDVPRGYAMR